MYKGVCIRFHFSSTLYCVTRFECIYLLQEYERFINKGKAQIEAKPLTQLKRNLRCALRSIDIKKVKQKSGTEAEGSYRVYRIPMGKSLRDI